MTSLVLAVLGASLVGSVHCAAMCGGLVGVYAVAPGPRGSRRPGAGHAAYHAGRLVAYLGLGAIAGTIGASADLAGTLAGVGRVAATAAGAGIAAWGTLSLLECLGVSFTPAVSGRWLRVPLAGALGRAAQRGPLARAAAVGLATGLMPCGWLYAFVAAAAGTASPLAGAGLMLVFWLGTVPALLGVGVGVRALAWPLRRYAPALAALAMVVMGLFTVMARLHALH